MYAIQEFKSNDLNDLRIIENYIDNLYYSDINFCIDIIFYTTYFKVIFNKISNEDEESSLNRKRLMNAGYRDNIITALKYLNLFYSHLNDFKSNIRSRYQANPDENNNYVYTLNNYNVILSKNSEEGIGVYITNNKENFNKYLFVIDSDAIKGGKDTSEQFDLEHKIHYDFNLMESITELCNIFKRIISTM